MNRLTRLGVLAPLAAASAALAQGTMTFSWTVGDTGNNDGTLQPGENALCSLWASMDPAGVGFAGSIFDILGGGEWDSGTVVGYDNLVDNLGTGDGHLLGNGDILGIESFQLPPFFNQYFDVSNPVELYRIEWEPADYTVRWIEVASANHQNASVYVDNFGTSVEYDMVIGRAQILVIPAPAGAVVVGLGLVGRGRRRERTFQHPVRGALGRCPLVTYDDPAGVGRRGAAPHAATGDHPSGMSRPGVLASSPRIPRFCNPHVQVVGAAA